MKIKSKALFKLNPIQFLRILTLTAAIALLLLVVAGVIVRTSDSTLACPDWPTCFGSFGVPAGLQAQIQVVHRGLALMSTLLVVAASAWSWIKFRSWRAITMPLSFGAGVMVAESLIGAGLIYLYPASTLSGVHMALALTALGLSVWVAVAVYQPTERLAIGKIEWGKSRTTTLTAVSLVLTLAVMVSGTVVTTSGIGSACSGWPLCNGGLPDSPAGWITLGHRLLAALAAAGMVALFRRAWRTQRSQEAVLTAITAAFFLFLGQVLIGALKVTRGFPMDLVALHAAASAGMWAALAAASAAVIFANRSEQEELVEAHQPAVPMRSRVRDFFLLNKPIIVALLLVTTYAGMVVGGRHIPGLDLTFWTLLGGALAAGGSSALNQYIDRNIDGAMQRTAKRPLPAGRLTPAEGLAYGAAACLTAFFLLAGFVNLLAAVLSLLGMVYYVLIYSIWLKHATVQNIVIGGGAGAIPPLVGWAAASGSLNIPSLFLFALIFLWTPPHFWALALVRSKDYARAGVPMLPVVRGEQAARSQIFIYTLELVGLTLLMPLFKIAGSLFLVSAVVLGLWLIYTAWQVLHKGGNKVAWKMYRYSSMYLAFIMLAMVLDVLL